MMKRILLSASLSIALSGVFAVAQATNPPNSSPAPSSKGHYVHHHHHNPQREAAFLSKKLNLTSDQTAKLEPILANRDQKMAALWSNSSLTPDERKQQMRTIHQDTEQQLSTILTPDQLEQLKSHHGGHGSRGNSQPQANPSPGL
jgi:periplasmic protein CpxP/Spy